MRRRDFIASLGALGVPSAGARAQQSGRIRTIGFLGANKPAIQKPWTDAFVQRLRELGYVDGQTSGSSTAGRMGRRNAHPSCSPNCSAFRSMCS